MIVLFNKILSLIDLGYDIDAILKELNIEEESLADMLIELETEEFIILKNKRWILTEKGKNILKEREGLLKKLKIEYIRGNIDKEEFQKRKKELESVSVVEKVEKEKDIEIEGKLICPKCGKENKIGSRFCAKCGVKMR